MVVETKLVFNQLEDPEDSQEIAPISIFDAEVQAHVNHPKRSKTKAARACSSVRRLAAKPCAELLML